MYFIVLVLILIFIFLVYRSNSYIDISRFEIKISKKLDNFNNFKIVQISDLQNNNFNGKLKKIIEKENPNVIFITGDLLDFYNTKEKVCFDLVSSLVKKFPLFFVSGNHEARVLNYENFEKSLEKLGVIVLNNSNFNFFVKNQKINILGIKDPLFVSKNFQEDVVESFLNKLNYEEFNILLSHRPEHFFLYVNKKIDLVFSGHAHGGQFIIPFFKIGFFSPNQKFFPKFTNGIYEKEKTKMIVSRGLGNSKFRLRFNNPYNLVVVTLKTN